MSVGVSEERAWTIGRTSIWAKAFSTRSDNNARVVKYEKAIATCERSRVEGRRDDDDDGDDVGESNSSRQLSMNR